MQATHARIINLQRHKWQLLDIHINRAWKQAGCTHVVGTHHGREKNMTAVAITHAVSAVACHFTFKSRVCDSGKTQRHAGHVMFCLSQHAMHAQQNLLYIVWRRWWWWWWWRGKSTWKGRGQAGNKTAPGNSRLSARRQHLQQQTCAHTHISQLVAHSWPQGSLRMVTLGGAALVHCCWCCCSAGPHRQQLPALEPWTPP